jgi:hypothetical protein
MDFSRIAGILNPFDGGQIDAIKNSPNVGTVFKQAAKTVIPGISILDQAKDTAEGSNAGVAQAPGYTTNTYQAPIGQPIANYADGGTTGGATGSYSGGGTSQPAYSQQDLDYLDNQRSLYQALLDRIGSTETSGLNNIENQYQGGLDQANTSRSRTLSDYMTKENSTREARSSAFDKVNQNTNSLANSVRRILGLAGAAGSSAMGDITRGVAGEASRNRSNVLQDYAGNMGQLDQARKYSDDDYNALLGDLGRQRNTAKENFQRGILGQRQGLQSTIDEIAAKRAALMGGDATAALRQGQERYLGFEDQINALPNQFNNTIKARDVAAKPISLKDYMVDRQAINANNSMGNDQYSPYGQFMKKQQDEEEQKLEY